MASRLTSSSFSFWPLQKRRSRSPPIMYARRMERLIAGRRGGIGFRQHFRTPSLRKSPVLNRFALQVRIALATSNLPKISRPAVSRFAASTKRLRFFLRRCEPLSSVAKYRHSFLRVGLPLIPRRASILSSSSFSFRDEWVARKIGELPAPAHWHLSASRLGGNAV